MSIQASLCVMSFALRNLLAVVKDVHIEHEMLRKDGYFCVVCRSFDAILERQIFISLICQRSKHTQIFS